MGSDSLLWNLSASGSIPLCVGETSEVKYAYPHPLFVDCTPSIFVLLKRNLYWRQLVGVCGMMKDMDVKEYFVQFNSNTRCAETSCLVGSSGWLDSWVWIVLMIVQTITNSFFEHFSVQLFGYVVNRQSTFVADQSMTMIKWVWLSTCTRFWYIFSLQL